MHGLNNTVVQGITIAKRKSHWSGKLNVLNKMNLLANNRRSSELSWYTCSFGVY